MVCILTLTKHSRVTFFFLKELESRSEDKAGKSRVSLVLLCEHGAGSVTRLDTLKNFLSSVLGHLSPVPQVIFMRPIT